ncbi:LysM peptidoglycan-binding domain-containing protein [Gulosibacter chungangensis]|uniref:LysM peptidoglycan-binding domain-containing protein n=1 Tax=Gulosibacter chungangensis TaxID=979746 RepID=A0A7J5B8W5_9MICO|nr:LysM peptidoglycan-binding domain-containing protein [Gulosibacter chungangensis]KAB1641864.1 LysM peptidoglycan-binding domain-containing protein [Gulosibacter chungangensis]
MTAISLNGSGRRNAGLKLTVRGRRLVAAMLFAPIGLGIGIGISQLPAAFAGDEAVVAGGVYEQFEVHTVLAGESLWDIASDLVASHGHDTYDVRDVVSEIQRLNGLSSSSLQAGQQLALPNL